MHSNGLNVLIVGAGLAGACYARTLADSGIRCLVIDRRPHIAGNCYDFENADGIRIHQYGPHLFHTSNSRVVEWVRRYSDWVPYEHRVKALLNNKKMVPMPPNMATLEAVFDRKFRDETEVEEFLRQYSVLSDDPKNALDWLQRKIGPLLTEIFFERYTKKMWGQSLRDTPAAVVKRVKPRTDTEDRYFPNDSFQALPLEGYTKFVENILDHKLIDVSLNTTFEKAMEKRFHYTFNSMPIDQYFDFQFGELPYRSIKFHNERMLRSEAPNEVVINYTDAGPFTRETWWHNLPKHDSTSSEFVMRTVEEPCDYRQNHSERYYPVKDVDGKQRTKFLKYLELSKQTPNIEFIGRCGTYQYLDMHQVINQSVSRASEWLKSCVAY